MQVMKFNFALMIIAILQVFGCDANGTHLKSKTLHVGFNGLSKVYTKQLYEDKESIENSWLKNALEPEEFRILIEQMDFNKQFVLVFSFGKRPNANGKIIMNYIKHTADVNSKQSNISTNINIGIADKKDCNIITDIESYPFIVELVNKPKEDFKLIDGGYAAYNFGDGCKTPISGKPTNE
jgi:hypothetical protein